MRTNERSIAACTLSRKSLNEKSTFTNVHGSMVYLCLSVFCVRSEPLRFTYILDANYSSRAKSRMRHGRRLVISHCVVVCMRERARTLYELPTPSSVDATVAVVFVDRLTHRMPTLFSILVTVKPWRLTLCDVHSLDSMLMIRYTYVRSDALAVAMRFHTNRFRRSGMHK